MSIGEEPIDGEAADRQWVHARTQELAVIAGRVLPDVAQADYEQAKRELAKAAARRSPRPAAGRVAEPKLGAFAPMIQAERPVNGITE